MSGIIKREQAKRGIKVNIKFKRYGMENFLDSICNTFFGGTR
jgi:hypothetical protein